MSIMELEPATPGRSEKRGEPMEHGVTILGHNLLKPELEDMMRRVILHIDSPGFHHGLLVFQVRADLAQALEDSRAHFSPAEHALINIVFSDETVVSDDVLQLLLRDRNSLFVELEK